MHERGSQYADTWGKDGCWHLTRAIVKQVTEKEINEEAVKKEVLERVKEISIEDL